MVQTQAKWPYPPGDRRHGEPKPPSIAAVWRMLDDDYGISPPTIAERIKTKDPVEVGDYDTNRKAFPVWLHVPGAAYPEKYWYEAESVQEIDRQRSSTPRG